MKRGRPSSRRSIVRAARSFCRRSGPKKVGTALMFISLDPDVLHALRVELEGKGVAVKDGEWGYRLMVVHDLDGNELYFPYPSEPQP